MSGPRNVSGFGSLNDVDPFRCQTNSRLGNTPNRTLSSRRHGTRQLLRLPLRRSAAWWLFETVLCDWSMGVPEGYGRPQPYNSHPLKWLQIRATYPIVDHRERYIAPSSFAFNPAATRCVQVSADRLNSPSSLYCGFEKAIEVFDIAQPGHNTSERLKVANTKKEKGGQKGRYIGTSCILTTGIISALAFATDYSGTFAAGSFRGSVSLYSEDTGVNAVGHLDGVNGGGVTQVGYWCAVLTKSQACFCHRKISQVACLSSSQPDDLVRVISSITSSASVRCSEDHRGRRDIPSSCHDQPKA